MTVQTLTLSLNIIELSQNTLIDLQLELLIPVQKTRILTMNLIYSILMMN